MVFGCGNVIVRPDRFISAEAGDTVSAREKNIMGVGEFIRSVPVPICGLSLGLASLDRFLRCYYRDVYAFDVFAYASFVILILFTVRILIDRRGVAEELRSPAVYGILPTYAMSVMLLSACAADMCGGIVKDIALFPWLAAVVACYAVMFFFVKDNVMRNFGIEKVFPSWMIVFIGYCVACTTSPSFGTETIGQVLFWSGVIGCAVMIPPAAYRVLRYGLPEQAVPQIAIFAAPANLCAAGCIESYGHAVTGITEIALMILALIGTVLFIAVIAYLPVMLNRKFSPSFSAFTFPLVISTVMFRKAGDMYGLTDNGVYGTFQTATVWIASAAVVYVLILYVLFFYRKMRKEEGCV